MVQSKRSKSRGDLASAKSIKGLNLDSKSPSPEAQMTDNFLTIGHMEN